ncbi:MAG: LEA type 2 family protein [Leptospiraceae bacterium]|nr:LEA type 2 family protein [Leptospiraceae bacterium]
MTVHSVRLKSYKLVVLATATLVVISCGSLFRRAFTQPKVSVENHRFENIALSGAQVILGIGIDNPNPIGLTVKNLKYKLDLDSEELIRGQKSEPIAIESSKKTVFELPLTVAYSGLTRGISGILYRDKIDYKFTGAVTVDTPVGDLDFDINESGSIPIPSRPEFSIVDVTVDEVGLSELRMTFTVKIDNNEAVELDLRKFKFNLKIQDENVFSIAKGLEVKLPQRKAVTLDVPVSFRFLGLSSSVIDTVRSGQMKYDVSFELDLDSRYGPFTLPWRKVAQKTLY